MNHEHEIGLTLSAKPIDGEGPTREVKMATSMRKILADMGEDPNRDGLVKSPERYARAMLFLTKGYHESAWDIAKDAIFDVDHNEIVVVHGIEIFSMCEHHLIPFMGKVGRLFAYDIAAIGLTDQCRRSTLGISPTVA